MESLVPAIIEQKVTGQEAFMWFRRLVRAHGSRAPGPHPDLWLQPDPQRLVAIPSWDWLRFRVDPARSRPVVAAARVAGSLERLTGLPHAEVDRRMRSVPGRSEEHTSELQSLMRISYAVFCLKKKNKNTTSTGRDYISTKQYQ